MPGVSRRLVVGVLGTGFVAAPAVAEALVTGVEPRGNEATQLDQERVRTLLHPLAPGSRLARWNVVAIHGMQHGALRLDVSGDDGHVFCLEVLARDPSALSPRAPGRTERFAIHVQNGGDGWLPTVEEQGLAAMTLATIIAANEAAVPAGGFLTYAQRLEQHRGSLLPAG